MSDEQGERETCPDCNRSRAECEQHWPLSENGCVTLELGRLRSAVQRSPAAAAADQPSPTEYNAETLATMLDQARAGNAKLQGELERVRSAILAEARDLEECATGIDPEGYGGIARRLRDAVSTNPAPSAPAERSVPVSKSQAKRIAIQSESAPGGTAGVEPCPVKLDSVGLDGPWGRTRGDEHVYAWDPYALRYGDVCVLCGTGRAEAESAPGGTAGAECTADVMADVLLEAAGVDPEQQDAARDRCVARAREAEDE